MSDAIGLRVADVLSVLDARYPPERAEEWDAVGLALGSRAAPAHQISYAVDLTLDVLAEAKAHGSDLLVVHHPPFLRGVRGLDLDHPKARLAAEALGAGQAVLVAHTNADVSPSGVVDALADQIGLRSRRPLVARSGPALDKVTTNVPTQYAEAVLEALAAAGAGRLGAYERCAFSVPGEGTFRPLSGANPFVGQVGRPERVAETRLEMVLPRSRRAAVREALRTAHPYEEPAYDFLELADVASPDVGLGRIGRLAEPTRLGALVEALATRLAPTARGLLLAGDPDRTVATVAVQAGAGDDLLDVARSAGAEVYLTSDLRHHPASEARAWSDAPALVDIPHWAAEQAWLPVVQRLVDEDLGAGRLPSRISALCTDPWTARYG